MKQVLFNQEAKEALQKGVDIVGNAVGSTMGACGKTVIISNHFTIPPFATKDGITVANSIVLEDEIQNTGAQFVRMASAKTAKDAGDGTTQTAVLSQSIINQGLRLVKDGKNPQEIKTGIDKAVSFIVNELGKLATPVGDSNDKIKNIATISANNDTTIGQLIADAYAKIGNEGVLLIEDSGTIETKVELIDGLVVDRGYISPEFANNKAKMKAEFENPIFVVCDYTIKNIQQVFPLLQQLQEMGNGKIQNPVVFVCADCEGEFFSTMVINNKHGVIQTCIVKAPSAYRKETMEDVAIATGATFICDEAGLKLESMNSSHVGMSKKVVITESNMTIIGGQGKEEKISEHINAIKVQTEDMKDEALKEVWQKRLGKISGSIGFIKVGAATEVELGEKKDRVDDAVRATKSAIEEGIVPGGGVALIRCANKLENTGYNWLKNDDEKLGAQIIFNACFSPLRRMLLNAGLHENESAIVDLVEAYEEQIDFGYNIKTMQYGDLVAEGVIDPAKVVRCALQNAASVAGAVITTDCLIVQKK